MHLVDYSVGLILAFSGLTGGLGAAMLALPPVKERAVRVLFWAAATSFGSSGIVWSATSDGYPLPVQMTVAAIVAALAAAGLVWGLAEIRGRTATEAAPEKRVERGPTLEALSGGRINAEGATIPGDLPFQFGKVETGGIIDMPGINVTRQSDGSFSIRPSDKPINRGFPPPTGEFRSLTDDQLRQRAKAIADDLRDFQQRFSAELQTLPRNLPTGTSESVYRPFHEKWRLEYEAKHINEAHSLVSEYLARGHSITARDRAESTGGTMLFYKSFAGPSAALEVAAFLDRLAADK